MNPAMLERVLSNPRLPTLPVVAMKVIELTEKKDISLREIAETIQNDQALSAKILKTVNSSFYGVTKKCSTINQAMVALGINTVKTLALGFSLVSTLKQAEGGEFDFVEYWTRGVYTAVGARSVAQAARLADPEEAFLGGLLQDVGMVALYQALGKQYIEVLGSIGGDHRALVKHEIERLEVQHPDVGAMLAARWKFPEALVTPIKYHERPSAAPREHTHGVRCVGLGNLAADIMMGREPAKSLNRFYDRAQQWFGISNEQSDLVLSGIRDGAKQVSHLLRVPLDDSADPGAILGAASERLVEITMEQESQTLRLSAENAQLQQAAVTDTLTGVANRRRFNDAISEAFERARGDEGALAVIFIDADKFKGVNDTHGHQAGDAVLVELATRLAAHFEPACGLVCRYGGEEFAIILEGVGRAEAGKLIESFRDMQSQTPIDISAAGSTVDTLNVTISAGVAAFESATSHAFTHPEQLVRAADQAVYAAKGSGRNCVRVFNPRPPSIAA